MTVKRINLDIDSELWKEVGIAAIELGIKKKDVVEKALNDFLNNLWEGEGNEE